MKIAVCSDELYPVNEFIVHELERLGHQVIPFGAVKTHQSEPWIQSARDAAEAIHHGACDEGIFFCWTGTGISMVANKIPGIRAALCTDAQTAKGARIWNRANVLALSNRLLTVDLAKEILDSWFNTKLDAQGSRVIQDIEDLERKYQK
ncbi:RpiB/LacA/LacB family sugar-phosphate isomerase [Fluoribacter dumoffii]|uniref:Ribose-5-phosphate isomerase B n=1 Tax=Fluoribacter dumoffii TaxID=463 RepID=A0A377G996_9GAMM|nr:RpiB/LacA/LacB family sugar-phosphate isomerase [Fluoribacter dumoffii]KTC90266.1 ribose/galactose isomerase [Fluoribacter dumoffii NY 23]MCW8385584.1 RpiB/LacA/LacB family sugar-phosphate isomerase [Fluoribacter dumoffii]MCW8418611.1 RpiB/LacA/LacB family sugar-phosphate isomerase [Fluoribacter dumoffii]MCW8453545.1 RpiB/LacA/LacB family sugar-phosphate isomerase [Fluoribacter dumoffii]MCW8459236.1 RpiB/LacA/LacB family sugar-phosphate isomerase [Fluoribacter dumoffii]